MSKFSEPEICLLRQWSDARLVEDSMEAIREKHSANFETVLDTVQRKHEELNARLNLVPKGDGRVGIGKKSWPSKPKYYLSGFWLGDILLDNLLSDDEDAPHKFVWVNYPEGNVDLEQAHGILCDAAKRAFAEQELNHVNLDRGQWSGKFTVGISCPLMESRAEFLDLLMNNEARGLTACFVAHLESMLGFAAVLDEIHKSVKKGRN